MAKKFLTDYQIVNCKSAFLFALTMEIFIRKQKLYFPQNLS